MYSNFRLILVKFSNFMKLILNFISLIMFISPAVLAQETQIIESTKINKCSAFYVGFSSGLNNQNGILGLNFEIPLATQFSLSSGIGMGSWGLKTFGETIIYFNNRCQRSGALVLGATYAFGPKDLIVNVSTSSGSRDVSVSGTAATNMFVSYRQFFITGKQENKFFFQLGYSARLIKPEYYINGSYAGYYSNVNSGGYDFIRSLAPGGIIVGVGLLFGTKN